MNHSLRVALCRSITARAHLAGAEAAELQDTLRKGSMSWPMHPDQFTLNEAERLMRARDAARRRYWREQAACELLTGRRWAEAEALGVEP
jgi:hypothetical protein